MLTSISAWDLFLTCRHRHYHPLCPVEHHHLDPLARLGQMLQERGIQSRCQSLEEWAASASVLWLLPAATHPRSGPAVLASEAEPVVVVAADAAAAEAAEIAAPPAGWDLH